MELIIISKFPQADKQILYPTYEIISISCIDNKIFCIDSTGEILLCDINNSQLSLIPLSFKEKGIIISCGCSCSGLITDSSDLYIWGKHFQSYSDGIINYSISPLFIDCNVSCISCGGSQLGYIKSGLVYSCDISPNDDFGLNISNIFNPIAIRFPEKIKEISCGINHTGILSISGWIYTTGDNKFGQLGLGHKKNINSFERVDLEKTSCISFGHHSAAISFGKLYI